MIYKVYINDRPLYMLHKQDLVAFDTSGNVLVAHYIQKVKFLHNYIDLMEKSQKYDAIYLCAADPNQLWADFRSVHELLPAAGGIVFNPKGEFVAIYRRSSWDLPKGKIETGESEETAAVREVQEECGLREVLITKPLLTTWHTYSLKKKRILKPTSWFEMATTDFDLVPQTEEDIEKIIWTTKADFLEFCKPVYLSILEVIHAI